MSNKFWAGASLYGDLPPPSASDSSTTTKPLESKPAWSGIDQKSKNLLASVVQMKAKTAQQSKPSKPAVAKVHVTGKVSGSNASSILGLNYDEPDGQSGDEDSRMVDADEYDPMKPNDYDSIAKRRDEARQERYRQEEMRREMEEMDGYYRDLESRSPTRRTNAIPPPPMLSGAMDSSSRDRDRDRRSPSPPSFGGLGNSASSPPPPPQPPAQDRMSLDISGDEAYLRRARMSGAAPPAPSMRPPPPSMSMEEETSPTTSSSSKPKDFAQRMMEKMGWKGQGLGRQQQGIIAPLQHTKTGRATGKIEIAPSAPAPPPPVPVTTTTTTTIKRGKVLRGKPSRVVLLRNMVGPGEVDDELDRETAEECARFGKVLSVLIFEVTEGVQPWEAVRIFVKFESQESATKAILELHGRFFGGRTVHGCFFDEARFDACDLAPSENEEKVQPPQ